MKRTLRKLLILPLLVVGMTATAVPAHAGSPYTQADTASDGTATATPAGENIPYSAGGGRKVR